VYRGGNRQSLRPRDRDITHLGRVPGTPQPGIDIHPGEPVAGGGELALERLAAHLAVAHHRQADLLLDGHDLAHGPVLGGLQTTRRQLTPGVGLARIAQETRAEQAPNVLNPRKHRHNSQRPTPSLARWSSAG